MKLLVLLLMSLYASSAWSQDFDFRCGFSQMSKSGINQAAGKLSSTSVDYRRGQIRTLILFSKFKNTPDPFNLQTLGDRDGELNQSADSLLSITHEGSLAHYFNKMSGGVLTLVSGSGGVKLVRYEATGDSLNDYYTIPNCGNWVDGLERFVTQVLQNADRDNSVNFSQVDLVAVITPREFAECAGGTVFDDIQVQNNVTVSKVITATEVQSFPLIVGVLAHEYGHVMRLPELYDITGAPPADQGAGIGLWGVMGRGPVGWRRGKIGERYFGSGPTGMSAWSRMRVGWITPETVSADTLGVQIHDINSADGKVFKISVPNSDKEYFLVENRQNTYSETKNRTMVGSYYDDYAPESGLAVWHVDDTVGFSSTTNTNIDDETNASLVNANANEFHKRVDLECADGLFSDQGYPGNMPDAVDGDDNLDYFSFDSTYVKNGNAGDSTYVWNGPTGKLLTDTMFTHYTNPSTAGYNGNQQNVFTGIALRDIRSSSPGVMQMDIYLQYWSGPITANTTWSGRITVGGDVTIESGVTLTVERGTEVRFLANTDDTGGGKDQTRSELIVKGKLDAAAGNITFRSSDDPGTNADWYGIRVASGGTADLSGATIQNGFRCVQNEGGTLTVDANPSFSNCGATIVETQNAYRASQTAPLFDAAASGTPDNWASSIITWTDAAPRVWRISRMRSQGGTWSKWGTLKKSSERPAAPPVFYYHRSASAPPTPGNTTSDQPPSGWLSSEPEATATQGVWRTERTRPAGETHYHFSTPTQITPPGTETQYAYRASQTAPLFDTGASGTPDNWASSIITWTDAAPRVWRIRRTRPSGGTWSEWGNLEKYSERPAVQLVSFYRQAVNNPGAPLSTTASATPANWATSNPGATTTFNVWRTQRSRPTGDTHYQFTTPTIFAFATSPQYAYRLHTSGTTAPPFSATASVVPSGWSSLRQTPTPSNRYEWRISRTRSTGGSWSSWGSAVVVVETQYAYRASQTAPLYDAPASGTPDNWASSALTWTDAAPRVWSIRRTRPSGGNWSEWGTLEKYSERPAASATFYRRTSSAPATPATQTSINIATPSTWQTTQPTATATEGVWSPSPPPLTGYSSAGRRPD